MNCPICDRPLSHDTFLRFQGAKVYHLACLMQATRHLRERNADVDESANPDTKV